MRTVIRMTKKRKVALELKAIAEVIKMAGADPKIEIRKPDR